MKIKNNHNPVFAWNACKMAGNVPLVRFSDDGLPEIQSHNETRYSYDFVNQLVGEMQGVADSVELVLNNL